MAGTSVVSLGNSGYVVSAGFTPGLPDDFGLLRFGLDGQVQSQRFISDRDHKGSLSAGLSDSSLWVKAIGLEGGKISLAFDTVWLPQVGTASTITGWQVSLGSQISSGLRLTDLVKAGDSFFLRADVGNATNVHMALLKVKPSGEVEWVMEYPQVRDSLGVYTGVAMRQGGKLFLTADGHLLTGGYLRLANGQEQAVVLWLNQDGSLFKSVTVKMQPFTLYKGARTDNSHKYQDMALLANGDIVLVQNFSVDGLYGGALITRLSPAGEHIWTIGLHALNNIGGTTFVNEIRQEGNQLILVGGSTAFEAPNNNFYHFNMMMASLDDSGQPLWVRSLGVRKYSGSSLEYKTDFATSFLPVGDGRMIVTGTSDSFGSVQNYDRTWPDQHYDLVLGMVDLGNGGINGASNLMWSADLEDKYKVWAEEKPVTLGTCDLCEMQPMEDVSMSPITYTSEDLDLVNRDLDGGVPDEFSGLTFTPLDHGRGLISSSTFFGDPITDIDHDGLDQDWENAALEQVKPLIEVDEQELWLKNQDHHFVVDFVRVTPYPSSDKPDYILFEYAITWSMDYGGADMFEVHRGDVEQVIMAWRIETERSLRLEWVYTSAHGSTNSHAGVWHVDDPSCNRAYIADTGFLTITDAVSVGTELMCDTLKFKDNRVWVQASENKHAMYITKPICEDHATLVSLEGRGIWGEDCGGGGEFLFEAYNIGEPDNDLLIDNLAQTLGWKGLTESQVDSLAGLFPNEKILEGNLNEPGKFCGGLLAPPKECSGSTVASKLGSPPGILAAMLGPTTYRVSIYTRDILFAGTDAGVFIKLYAEDGGNFALMLDGSFEQDSFDVFHIGDPAHYIGDIVKIGLGRNDNISNPDYYVNEYGFFDLSEINPTADWNVGDVVVENKVTGHRWVFTVNQDLTNNSEHIYWPDAEQ